MAAEVNAHEMRDANRRMRKAERVACGRGRN